MHNSNGRGGVQCTTAAGEHSIAAAQNLYLTHNRPLIQFNSTQNPKLMKQKSICMNQINKTQLMN